MPTRLPAPPNPKPAAAAHLCSAGPLPATPRSAKKGGFKDAFPDDLVVAVLKDVVERAGVKPEVGGRCHAGDPPAVLRLLCQLPAATLRCTALAVLKVLINQLQQPRSVSPRCHRKWMMCASAPSSPPPPSAPAR